LLAARDALYAKARLQHPARWTRQTRNWTLANEVYLNGTARIPRFRRVAISLHDERRPRRNAAIQEGEMATGVRDLESFVREALMRGSTREQTAAALHEAGWEPEQIKDALSAFAEVAFVVPVPRPKPYVSAREAFFYLVLFTTLYLSAYHLGSLLFDLINRAFPDPAVSYLSRTGDMRWSVATIIIAFPVFLWLSVRIGREVARQPVRRQSAVRRWLTYLTLFVAAVTLLIDLITLVDSLLGGELTVRFLLKVGVVAVIAGTAFGYYLRDLRRDEAAS
jgi:hypothetical protein